MGRSALGMHESDSRGELREYVARLGLRKAALPAHMVEELPVGTQLDIEDVIIADGLVPPEPADVEWRI